MGETGVGQVSSLLGGVDNEGCRASMMEAGGGGGDDTSGARLGERGFEGRELEVDGVVRQEVACHVYQLTWFCLRLQKYIYNDNDLVPNQTWT